MTSGTGNDVILSFYLNDTAKDLRFGAFDVNLVPKIEKSFKAEVLSKHPELQVHWAGVAPHQYYLKEGLNQTNQLNLGIPVLACFLFWLFFANARIGVLFVFMISLAAILVYGTMAAFGAPIDVLANTLVLMVMLSSLEDFLFLIHHHQNGIRPWRQGFRRLITPAFFTSLTTAVGFLSLSTSNLATIRRFGVFAAFAAMLEWAIVFLILPAFLQRFPRLRDWLLPKFDRRKWIQGLSDKIARFRFPRLISIALISVYAFSSFGLSRLRVSDAPANIFQKGHPVTEALDYLKRTRGWESQVSLVYQDSHRTTGNRAVEAALTKLPNVVTIESPYGIEDYLTEGLPSMEMSQVRDVWRYSDASSRYISKDGTSRSIVYLRKIDTASIDALSAEVTRLCPAAECHLAGTLVAYTEFGDRVLDTLLKSLGMSLILVSAVILYLLRAKGQTAYFSTLLSMLWGPFALICIFWAFDFPITYVTCTFASIVVGIAGDNTIQYLFAARSGSIHRGIDKQARASVLVTLMMMGLSLLFYGSYFASVRSLATLFVLGFALTLIGDLWVFKGLITSRRS
jgi:predicted RND superfamily exporter protein